MNRTLCNVIAGAGASMLAMSAASAGFIDNFANDVLTDSDSIAGVWNPINANGAGSNNGTFTETGGALVYNPVKFGQSATAYLRGMQSFSIPVPLTAEAEPVVMSVRDIVFTSGGTSVNDGLSVAFAFGNRINTNTTGNPSSQAQLRLAYDPGAGITNIIGGGRGGGSSTFLYTGSNKRGDAAGYVTGFDMSIAYNAYTLTVYGVTGVTPNAAWTWTFNAEEGSATTTVNYTPAWNAGNWDSESDVDLPVDRASVFLFAHSAVNAAPTTSTLSLGSIEVSAIPEPGALALLGLSGLGMLRRSRRQ